MSCWPVCGEPGVAAKEAIGAGAVLIATQNQALLVGGAAEGGVGLVPTGSSDGFGP